MPRTHSGTCPHGLLRVCQAPGVGPRGTLVPQPGCWTQLSGPCLRWEAGGSPQEVPRRGPHWAAVSGAHSPVSPGRPGGPRPFALASPFPRPGLLSASTPLLSPLLSHSRQVSLSPVPDVPQGGRPPPRPQAAAGAGPACRHKSPGAASAESGGQAGPVNTRGPDGRGVPGPLQADLGGRPVLGHGSRQGRGRGRQSGPDPHGPRDPLGGWQQPKGPDSWQCRLAPGRGKVWPGAQQTRSTTAPSRHGAKRGTVGHPDAMSPELCPEVSSPPLAAHALLQRLPPCPRGFHPQYVPGPARNTPRVELPGGDLGKPLTPYSPWTLGRRKRLVGGQSRWGRERTPS